MMHGIYAGPATMRDHPDLFWGLVASFWIGNLLLLLMNIPLVWVWVKLLSIPYKYVYPIVILMVCVGAYSEGLSTASILFVLAFGWLGYGLRLSGFEPAPFLVGFILGPMLEEYFQRAMVIARGDMFVLLSRPLTASLLGLSVIIIGWVVWRTWRSRPPAIEPASAPAE